MCVSDGGGVVLGVDAKGQDADATDDVDASDDGVLVPSHGVGGGANAMGDVAGDHE